MVLSANRYNRRDLYDIVKNHRKKLNASFSIDGLPLSRWSNSQLFSYIIINKLNLPKPASGGVGSKSMSLKAPKPKAKPGPKPKPKPKPQPAKMPTKTVGGRKKVQKVSTTRPKARK